MSGSAILQKSDTAGADYNPRMQTRRQWLTDSGRVAALLAAAGWAPWVQAQSTAYAQGAFDAKSMPESLKALGLAAPVESKDVTITGPDIAENGAVVPVAVATTLPGAKRLLVLIEKNPAVLSAVFELNDAIEPAFSTRVKMAQSSNVYAVAIAGDGRVLFAQKEIKVTLGGCGG
jgi:sulfur-oxidizing protein SoxY